MENITTTEVAKTPEQLDLERAQNAVKRDYALLVERQNKIEALKNTLLEALTEIFPDIVLVEKDTLTTLMDNLEEALGEAESAQSNISELNYTLNNAESEIDNAVSNLQDVKRELSHIIQGIS